MKRTLIQWRSPSVATSSTSASRRVTSVGCVHAALGQVARDLGEHLRRHAPRRAPCGRRCRTRPAACGTAASPARRTARGRSPAGSASPTRAPLPRRRPCTGSKRGGGGAHAAARRGRPAAPAYCIGAARLRARREQHPHQEHAAADHQRDQQEARERLGQAEVRQQRGEPEAGGDARDRTEPARRAGRRPARGGRGGAGGPAPPASAATACWAWRWAPAAASSGAARRGCGRRPAAWRRRRRRPRRRPRAASASHHGHQLVHRHPPFNRRIARQTRCLRNMARNGRRDSIDAADVHGDDAGRQVVVFDPVEARLFHHRASASAWSGCTRIDSAR